MAGYGDVRRWQSGSLDDAEQQLKVSADTLPWIADDLNRAAKPAGWYGLAADAAFVKRGQLVDDMEQLGLKRS